MKAKHFGWETDQDLTTAGKVTIQRPINITRTNLSRPAALKAGSVCIAEIRSEGNTVHTPEFNIANDTVVDHVLRFELIDELGFDAGIGFILGKAKQ